MIKEYLRSVKLQNVMTKPVITVRDTEEFEHVHEKYQLYNIRHIPVINETGVLVGLISQRDLYRIHSPHKLEDGAWYYDRDMLNTFILKNVMVTEIFTLKPSQSLFEAIDAIVRFKYGAIPIIDDYRMPCGIVTRDGILKYLLSQ